MTPLKIGDALPGIQVSATTEQPINLADYQGRNIIIYFYPKDSTPGCTQEGQDFRDRFAEFNALNCVIFGVSRDSINSHNNFKCKQNFPFELISDPDESLCQLFDVIKMKNMYGKQVRGIERSTFLINAKGILSHEWRKVKVKGHIDEILQTLTTLAA